MTTGSYHAILASLILLGAVMVQAAELLAKMPCGYQGGIDRKIDTDFYLCKHGAYIIIRKGSAE